MNCKDAQNKILEANGSLSADVQEHLLECSACREFAETHQHVLGAMQPVEPSRELDAAVLQAGKRVLRERSGAEEEGEGIGRAVQAPLRFSRGRSPVRATFQWQWLAAACVALGFTLLLAFMLNSGSLLSEKESLAVRNGSGAGTAAQSLKADWTDSDLELELLTLETELTFAVDGDAIATESTETGNGSIPGSSGSGQSVDEALFEMELNLLLDSQNWLETPAQGGA